MKKKTLLISIHLISTFLCYAQMQLPFTAYENNPVLEAGTPGEWDEGGIFLPFITEYDGTIYLFFTGGTELGFEPGYLGYATSTDGYNFTKSPDNPIFGPDGSGFDAWSVNESILLYENSSWVLFYNGDASSSGYGPGTGIGRATAPNLSGPWDRLDVPILEAGSAGDWDSYFISPMSVLKDETGAYIMYYSSTITWFPDGPFQIGMATSDDGTNWIKYDNPETTNPPYSDSDPVLKVGVTGSWDEVSAWYGCVEKTATGYEMFYYGSNSDNEHRIGYATSLDGIVWTKLPGPIYDWYDDLYALNNGYYVVEGPKVQIIESSYFMYYDYGPIIGKISLATAPALAQTIHVPGDQPTIQAAIAIATHGDTVLVDEGTFYENINFLGKAITVASQFLIDGDTNHINNTIIDGSQPANPDIGSVVTFDSGEDTTSIIVGFTIQGGTGTPSSWGDGFSGGGIFCAQSGAKIENNNIIDNNCVSGGNSMSGGGIFADTSYNRIVIIRNNLISENSCISNQAGTQVVTGGGISVLTSAVITGNTIKNNYVYHGADGQALGGGIEGYLSKCIIKNNIIKDNIIENTGNSYQPNGCGIFLQQTQEGTIISGNWITGNKGIGYMSLGGGISTWNNEGNLIIDNNIIEDNDVCRGSGLRLGVYSNVVKITNNIIRNNFPSTNNTNFSRGGGIYFTEASADLKNTGRIEYRDTDKNPKTNLIFSKNFLNVISNNNLLNNSCNEGGGIFVKTAIDNLLAFNNIFYDNSASLQGDALHLMSNSLVYLYHNDIDTNDISGTGNWEGEGNIFVDPLFDMDGYHILLGSPCIEVGITEIEKNGEMYYCPDHDIDGQSRPLNATADIGADEVQLSSIPVQMNLTDDLVLYNSPNPFSGNTVIFFELKSDSYSELSIYDLTGKKILTFLSKKKKVGKHEITLDTRMLENGIYFCVLKTNKMIQSTKLIKL